MVGRGRCRSKHALLNFAKVDGIELVGHCVGVIGKELDSVDSKSVVLVEMKIQKRRLSCLLVRLTM